LNIFKIQPIQDEPILFIEDKKILVIADLHIGIETELREHGLNPLSQTEKMLKRLVSICKKYKPEEIILLGDIKHNIPSSTFQERKDVKKFLEQIQKLSKIHIIPGNHDGNIHKFAPENIIYHPSDGFILENIGFVHGHRWPNQEVMKCDQIIAAHTHPTVMLIDRLEYKSFEPCWLKGNFIKNKLKEKYPNASDPEILIVPAFNPLCGGIAVNSEGVTGPLGKLIDIENSIVYLLDGTSLGTVKNVK
jgi:putative SbcD/Mre11-related phosphoesterase